MTSHEDTYEMSAKPSSNGAKPSRAPQSPAERARALVTKHTRRLPTGWPTFDAACRGGIPLGRRVFIVGPPGLGKTTICTDLAVQWSRAGIVVAILAADEEADGLLVRLGQALGLSREELEDANPAACEALAKELEALPLVLVDADEDGATVESATAELVRVAGDRPRALIVDSIQTARTADSDAADGPRARVDSVIGATKRASKVSGCLVIATSEAGRGAYRSKRTDERVAAIAAGKESSAIEYQAHALLVLSEVEGEAGQINLDVPKMRFGRKDKASCRLRQDFARATLVEVPRPDEQEAGVTKDAQRYDRAKVRIVRLLAKHTDLKTRNAVHRAAGGNKGDNLEALSELMAEGKVALVNGAFRLHLEVVK